MDLHSTPDGRPDLRVLRSAAEPAVDFRRRVSAVAAEVAGLRRAVLASAAGHGIGEAQQADIALAVSEACSNAVAHAYVGAAAPGALTVESYRDARELVVVVTDEGSGMAPRADSPGLGLGLALIARLTQRLEIGANQPHGTRILMGFSLAAG